MNRACGKTVSGFTLIEVLVSLAILAVALASLYSVFGDDLGQTSRIDARTTAAGLAQSLLAEIGRGTPLRDGDAQGRFGNGFRWHLHVAPYGDSKDRQSWPVAAHQVSVEVSWMEGRFERLLRLDTLRLMPREVPR